MRLGVLAIAVASALALSACGGKNERPKAIGGATSQSSSVPQSGGVGRYAYSSERVSEFMDSCRKLKGGTDSNCRCVLNHLKLNTPESELQKLIPLEQRSSAPRRPLRKLRAAGRSCGFRL